jgi:hypothetical protein
MFIGRAYGSSKVQLMKSKFLAKANNLWGFKDSEPNPHALSSALSSTSSKPGGMLIINGFALAGVVNP